MFNAHHTAWGCLDNDTYGIGLLDAIHANNLIYLNNGKFTRINPSGGENSAVDLSLTSPCFQPLVEWDTMEDTYGSDHLPIEIVCNITPKMMSIIQHKKWNTNKANWDYFYIESLKKFTNLKSNQYNDFMATLNEILEHSIPTFEGNKNKRKGGKSWWNDKCSEVVSKRKVSFVEYKNNPNINNLINYKKADARAKKILKEEKRKNWQNFCMSLNKNTPS